VARRSSPLQKATVLELHADEETDRDGQGTGEVELLAEDEREDAARDESKEEAGELLFVELVG